LHFPNIDFHFVKSTHGFSPFSDKNILQSD